MQDDLAHCFICRLFGRRSRCRWTGLQCAQVSYLRGNPNMVCCTVPASCAGLHVENNIYYNIIIALQYFLFYWLAWYQCQIPTNLIVFASPPHVSCLQKNNLSWLSYLRCFPLHGNWLWWLSVTFTHWTKWVKRNKQISLRSEWMSELRNNVYRYRSDPLGRS